MGCGKNLYDSRLRPVPTKEKMMERFKYTDNDGGSLTVVFGVSTTYIWGSGHGRGPVMSVEATTELRDKLTEWLDAQPKEVALELVDVCDNEVFVVFGASWTRMHRGVERDNYWVVCKDPEGQFSHFLCPNTKVTVVR
jgi:hypothetical protein